MKAVQVSSKMEKEKDNKSLPLDVHKVKLANKIIKEEIRPINHLPLRETMKEW